MDNNRIAQIFQEIGDMLDIQGENRFRVLAYQRAAQNILSLPYDLKDLYQHDPKKLMEISGIGKDLASKIIEVITTGKCEYYEKLMKQFPAGLLQILRVRGIGPRKVKLFYAQLKIDSIEKLREAAEKNMLQDLPGMGPKSEAEILKALGEYDRHIERMTLDMALYEVEKLIEYLRKCPQCERVEYAGSLRRMKETVGDLDILVTCKKDQHDTYIHNAAKVMDFFIHYPEVVKVLGKGPTKTSVLLRSGVQSDLRVIDEKVFGAAMHYFTGSKEHNIVIRDRAKKKGLKINEYGVFQLKKIHTKKATPESSEFEEILIAGKTEEEVFKSVGLPWIPPEMRENRGEIEAAANGTFPTPIELKDLRGDLHVHSKWSDGNNEIEAIARAYRDAGFEYMALTDHSPAVKVAHGLTPERFELQWSEIDAINATLAREADAKKAQPFTILKGVECDILADGSLDLPDQVLKKMDVVVVSVHSRFNLPEKEQTERVLKAFRNPYVKIFGHPSGRLINQREPYSIDMEKIMTAAAERGIALEIDGQPSRLDLFDFYCQMAKAKGVKFTVDSDAHDIIQRSFLHYGIGVARRGWIEKKDVLNTMTLPELRAWWAERKKN